MEAAGYRTLTGRRETKHKHDEQESLVGQNFVGERY